MRRIQEGVGVVVDRACTDIRQEGLGFGLEETEHVIVEFENGSFGALTRKKKITRISGVLLLKLPKHLMGPYIYITNSSVRFKPWRLAAKIKTTQLTKKALLRKNPEE